MNLIAGGWTISNFDTFQGGFPLAFSLAKCTAGANSCRPNVIGDPSKGVSGAIVNRLNNYFNTAAFAQPADFTLRQREPLYRNGAVARHEQHRCHAVEDFVIRESRLSFGLRCSTCRITLSFPVREPLWEMLNFGRISEPGEYEPAV